MQLHNKIMGCATCFIILRGYDTNNELEFYSKLRLQGHVVYLTVISPSEITINSKNPIE